MDEAPRRGRFWTGLAAFAGGAALLAGGAIAGVMLARPKKKTPVPVWQPVAGDPTTGTIAIPSNASFAISVPASDPQMTAIATNLTGLASTTSGSILQGLQTWAPGTPLPAGFPDDGLGSAAWRATAVYAKAGDPLPLTVTQSTKVWLYAGVTSS